jgi:hypothetical protein
MGSSNTRGTLLSRAGDHAIRFAVGRFAQSPLGHPFTRNIALLARSWMNEHQRADPQKSSVRLDG